MKGRQLFIAVLTFLAGLYFLLDYVVPPVVPTASDIGVVTGKEAAAVELESGAVYRPEDTAIGRPELLVETRDQTGAVKPASRILRRVAEDEVVTVRRGPVSFGSLEGRSLLTDDGVEVAMQPGERLYSIGGEAPLENPQRGETVVLESRNQKVVAIDRGSVTLVNRHGDRENHRLGQRTVVMKLDRFDPPSEVQLPDLAVGDTVRIGTGSGFSDQRDAAAQFNLIITSMAFGMGLLSLGSVHFRSLRRRSPGWYTSLFFFAAVVLGVFAGQYKYSDPGTTERAFSDIIVLKVLAAVGSAIFSLLAFYMASAAYRAFRVRTVEAGLMMGSALIVMLGQTPFGTYLTAWLGESLRALWLPNVAAWILRVPTTAIFRGLIFGIMMGAIGTAIRYWLSQERSAAMGD